MPFNNVSAVFRCDGVEVRVRLNCLHATKFCHCTATASGPKFSPLMMFMSLCIKDEDNKNIWKGHQCPAPHKDPIGENTVFSSMLYGAESRKIKEENSDGGDVLLATIPAHSMDEPYLKRIGPSTNRWCVGHSPGGHVLRPKNLISRLRSMICGPAGQRDCTGHGVGLKTARRPRSRWLDDLENAAGVTLAKLLDVDQLRKEFPLLGWPLKPLYERLSQSSYRLLIPRSERMLR